MEIWKPFADRYEISTLGNVRSMKKSTPRILKPKPQKNGYLSVCLSFRGERKLYSIHRLVAKTFIPNPDNKPQINHVNGIKTDNRVENLEWVTCSQNIRHAYYTDLNLRGERHPNSKLDREQVEFCRSVYKPFNREFGATALARKFGVSKTTILFVIHGDHYCKANGQIHPKKNATHRLSCELRNKIRQAYKHGVSGCGYEALAKNFGVSKTTIRRIVNQI